MPERLRFERELEGLGLRDYDQPQPSEKPREVVVGERVTLDLFDFGFTGFTLESVNWEVPDSVVSFYAGDRKASLLVELSKSAFTKNPLAFCWVNAGDGKRVRVVARGKQGDIRVQRSFSILFDVKGPKLDYFKAEVAKPIFIRDRSAMRVSFGDRRAKAGVAWDWQVTMPAKYAGSLKDLQLVQHGRKRTRRLAPGGRVTSQMVYLGPGGKTDYILDIGSSNDEACKDLDAWQEPKYEFFRKAAAGESVLNALSFDAPASELEPLDVSLSVNEAFQYYILFKADKPNAIWVPVGKAEWFWKAEAVRGTSGWFFKSRSGGVKGGKGAATTEFPLYATNTCGSRWCTVKAGGAVDCS